MDRLAEFKKFLSCRIDLFQHFQNYPEKNWFDDEFTFENWLLGANGKATYGGAMDIRTQRYTTPLIIIGNKFTVFGEPLEAPGKAMELYRYNMYRGKKYNFTKVIYTDDKILLKSFTGNN